MDIFFQNFLDGGVGNLVGLGGGARAPAANQNEGNNEAPPQEAEEEAEEGEENGNNAAQGNGSAVKWARLWVGLSPTNQSPQSIYFSSRSRGNLEHCLSEEYIKFWICENWKMSGKNQ